MHGVERVGMKANALLDHWTELPTQPLFRHPDDVPFFDKYSKESTTAPILNCETYGCHEQAHHESFFHLSLMPVPYVGDLTRADIFILRLNPGFDGREYVVEQRQDIQHELSHTLKQDAFNSDYPFWYLNPDYSAHPGHDYWVAALRGIADSDYKLLSQRVALLQLVPYHSKEFSGKCRDGVDKGMLKSAIVIRDYLHAEIMPKVRQGQALLIATRGVRQWGLCEDDEADSIIIYNKPHEYRSRFLTPGTRGGREIIEWLQLNPSAP